MAYNTTSFSVATTATLVANPLMGSVSDPVPVIVFNNDATNVLYIGGPAVTSANGFPILPKTGVSFRLMASDPIYAITAGPTIDTRIMIGRQ